MNDDNTNIQLSSLDEIRNFRILSRKDSVLTVICVGVDGLKLYVHGVGDFYLQVQNYNG